MTIDERLDRITAQQERTDEMQKKNEIILADVLDSIKRLERIALAHTENLGDHEDRLRRLEERLPRKPQ